MSTPIHFDPAPYLRPPRLDVRQGVALAIALLSAVPNDATPGMKRTARAIRKHTVGLKKAWGEKRRATTTAKRSDKVQVDRRVDTVWGALRMRLEGCAVLPVEAHPRSEEARGLLAILFPDGLDFLSFDFESEWAESNQRLERIKAEKLEPVIDAIAGPEFLKELRAAHALYGEVLGITKPQEVPADATALLSPLRVLVSAIGDYLLQVVASVDREDPATIASARAALLPVDRLREATARRGAGRSAKGEADATEDDALPEVDPETPVPDVP